VNMVYFKVLFMDVSGEREKNHDKPSR
jgi:hypothetical protein